MNTIKINDILQQISVIFQLVIHTPEGNWLVEDSLGKQGFR